MTNKTAAIIIDFKNIRCGSCKVRIRDNQAKVCPNCSAGFDRVSSNHVGLADKLRAARGEKTLGANQTESLQIDLVSS